MRWFLAVISDASLHHPTEPCPVSLRPEKDCSSECPARGRVHEIKLCLLAGLRKHFAIWAVAHGVKPRCVGSKAVARAADLADQPPLLHVLHAVIGRRSVRHRIVQTTLAAARWHLESPPLIHGENLPSWVLHWRRRRLL